MPTEEKKVVSYEGGVAIVPAFETKKIVVPSPPSTIVKPINPRPGHIYVTADVISEGDAKFDELVAYADDNDVVIFLPDTREVEGMVKTYKFALDNALKTLDVKKDEIVIKYDEVSEDLANALADYLVDELDADIYDPEAL
jgi:hypothetical protein